LEKNHQQKVPQPVNAMLNYPYTQNLNIPFSSADSALELLKRAAAANFSTPKHGAETFGAFALFVLQPFQPR